MQPGQQLPANEAVAPAPSESTPITPAMLVEQATRVVDAMGRGSRLLNMESGEPFSESESAAILAHSREVLMKHLPLPIPEQNQSGEDEATTLPTQENLPASAAPTVLVTPAQSLPLPLVEASPVVDDWQPCYLCGSSEHWVRNCPLSPASPWSNEEASVDWGPASPPVDENWRNCFLCREEGHWAWACARNPSLPPADMCTTCARRGHAARDCMSPIGWRPAAGLCFECGLPGHSAPSCPVLALVPNNFAVCYLHGRPRGRNNLFRQGNALPRCKHDSRCDHLPPNTE
jgi:hypothetical protein